MSCYQSIRRKIIVAGLGIVLAIAGVVPAMAAMSDYCSVPPFLSSSQAMPNVMIMLDNSGSMADHPYNEPFDPKQFDSQHYFGYFEPTWMYKYNSTSKMWIHYTGADPGTGYTDDTEPIASGDFLNWAATRKLEVAKKLLVGGNPGINASNNVNPRTVTAPATVKLYSEDEGSSNAVNFDNSDITSLPSYTYLLVPGYSNVIYPFTGEYTYKLASGGCTGSPGCSKLSITPVVSTMRYTSLPTSSDILPSPNNWTKLNRASPPWGCSDNASYRCAVRDSVGGDPTAASAPDDDTSYIQNRTDTRPMLFGLSAGAFTLGVGSIQDVNVVVEAKMVENASGNCGSGGSRATRKIQGVLSLGSGATTNWASSSSTLNRNNNNWNKYAAYTFTWSTNPATGNAWTWDDIRNGASSTQWLRSFGVQNAETTVYNGTTQNCFSRETQVYIFVDIMTPSGTYSLVVDTGKQTITDVGILDNLADGARFGMATYGSGANGAKVRVPIDFSNSASIAEQVIRVTADSNTPVAESEYQVAPLFASTANAYTTGNKTVNDPYYFMYSHLTSHGTSTLNDQYVPCAKSYIIFMTDGEPTSDDFENASGSTVSKPTGFTTDRFRTGSFFDDLTLWGRTKDMRPGTCSGPQSSWTFPCIPSPPNQNVVTYPVFLFGNGSTLLQSGAINGGFSGAVPANGLPPCLNPTNPTQLKSGISQDELKLCFRFSSSNTSGIIKPIAPWGGTGGTVAGDDPPLTYYEGSDAYALQSSLTAAIADIMKRSASGTAVSVLTTSSRGVGSMLQAYFLPIRHDLREDTIADKQLVMSQDNVIKMYLDPTTTETMAARFTTDDLGTGGTLSTCSPSSVTSFSDINYLWEGGQKLALIRPSERAIYTAKKVIRGSTTTNTFSATNDFSVNSLTTEPTFSTDLNPDAVYSAENIVRYVRGECLETGVQNDTACGATANSVFRDRRVTVQDNSNHNIGDINGNVWKLGDIITSTPQVLGTKAINAYFDYYFDQTYYNFTTGTAYTTRSGIAFVGANDGMLHAFRVGYLKPQDQPMSLAHVWALFKNFFGDSDNINNKLGDEVWSYIPFNAFPYLKYLADPNYCHIYFNDLPVNLVDASLGGTANPNPADIKTSDSWRTIVIGSMRFGGCGGGTPQYPPAGAAATVGYSAYYAIDVTDAEHPVPLWEFTDADLGYTTSYPAIIRTGDTSTDKQTQNGYWYAVFGSGSKQLPGATSDISRTTTGYVYILDLKTGTLVKKIALDHNAIVSDILGVDANKDYLSEKLYLGTSYGDFTAGWKGKMISIDIPNQDLSASWTPTINYLFNGNAPFTAKPDATLDASYKTWVFAGSGKYFTALDQADTTQQIFLGFKDVGIATPLTIAALDNRTNTTTTGSVTSTKQICMYDSTINGGTGLPNGFGFQTVVTAVSTTIVTADSVQGWYINLATSPSAERVISRPTVFGGLVDFLTYVPNGDPCNAGGNSYLYSVGYATGVAPSTVSIYNPLATSGTSGNVTVRKGILMGPGTPPTGESIILTPKTGNENTLSKKVQVSTGVIVELTDNPPTDTTSRILHWLRK
jgi:hypothetical protein